jgi:hypothetical protein
MIHILFRKQNEYLHKYIPASVTIVYNGIINKTLTYANG